ncbi:GNAT family N-acetyltransferase [Hazenella coriacea]|nr:GNAT family N-acetyltransferase [Hazenella coriacea]
MLHGILQLHESIFGDASNVIQKMKSKPNLVIHVALDQTKVVGYKMGYELDLDTFYSWLGGVSKHYRNQGIASQLMEIQHSFLRDKGYTTVQTKTKNEWRNMLILNLKFGFNVIGTYTDQKGEPKIILEKNL